MAIKKDDQGKPYSDGEPSKYEPKGDFGPYNEPSWVPEGYCKCCAMVFDNNTKVERRRMPDELRALEVVTHTLNNNHPIKQCPVCDLP